MHYTNSVLAYIYKTLSLNNTISLSRHEQVCLIRLCFKRYFSHHQDERSISQYQEKYLLKHSPIKHTGSWCDKLIVLWTLSRQAKIFLHIPFNQFFFLQKQSICSFVWDLYYWLQLYLLLAILLSFLVWFGTGFAKLMTVLNIINTYWDTVSYKIDITVHSSWSGLFRWGMKKHTLVQKYLQVMWKITCTNQTFSYTFLLHDCLCLIKICAYCYVNI